MVLTETKDKLIERRNVNLWIQNSQWYKQQSSRSSDRENRKIVRHRSNETKQRKWNEMKWNGVGKETVTKVLADTLKKARRRIGTFREKETLLF